MIQNNIVFFNAFQSNTGIYISFGNLKKFYLRFGEQTKTNYFPTVPVYMMIMTPSGEPLFKTKVSLSSGEKSILAVIGSPKSIAVIRIPQPQMPYIPSKGYLRFINISSLGPASLIQKGKTIFNQVEFCEKTNYILSGEGKYHFTIKAPTVTKIADVTIGAGEHKTLFFLGNRIHSLGIIIHDRDTTF